MDLNDQFGYDDERFESTVDRNFLCVICRNVLKDPVMCRRNQHCFCRGCITEHLRRNTHRCPTCAEDLSVETLQDAPRIVTNYLNELSIRCDHYDRGCRELVQLQHLTRHVEECGFTPVVCENQGCGETISKRDRTYHMTYHNYEKMSTVTAGMKRKMTKISKEVRDVKTKLENTNTKLTTMDTEMANMKTKLASTDTKLRNVDTKVTNLQVNMEAAKFEEMKNEVRGMKMSLNEVKYGFDHLKEAVLDKDVSGTASGGREHQHIFVAGGERRNSVEIFNCRQRLWSLLKSMPVKRDDASSFIYNNHVIVAGGECRGDAVDNMIQMNIDPIPDLSINWSDFGAKLPVKLSAHSSVVYKDSLLVTGGYDENDVATVCIYEVQLKQPYAVKLLSKMPEPRVRHSTVLCDDCILIFGGKKSAGCKDNLSSVLSYDIKKNECRQLPALPYPVSEMATVKRSENVVIIGGADKDEKALNNVIIYNINTGNSHMLPPMSYKRKGCMAVFVENTIVVLGGMDERSKTLKSVESFSFDSYTWEELPDMKEPRYLATAVVV